MPALRDVVASLSQGCSGPREVAVRLHDFVRDIPFGFTPLFDGASPDATLALGRGHCIPKGSLFVAMLSLAGAPFMPGLCPTGTVCGVPSAICMHGGHARVHVAGALMVQVSKWWCSPGL